MARIAVGGFQHETNTFSSIPAAFADFVAPDAWPGLTRGGALLEAVAGINLPAAGFVQEARGLHHELVPLTWCSAQPSGRVTRDAYERISAFLLDDLRAHGAVDAVYLDLHGAMVAEHLDDADGEILRRVRNVVGPAVPVVASLDFHANISLQMAQAATALVSYRTYPHVDMADCGARAARVMHEILRGVQVAQSPGAGRFPDPADLTVHAGRAAAVPDGGGGNRRARAGPVRMRCAGISRRPTSRTADPRSTPAGAMRQRLRPRCSASLPSCAGASTSSRWNSSPSSRRSP